MIPLTIVAGILSTAGFALTSAKGETALPPSGLRRSTNTASERISQTTNNYGADKEVPSHGSDADLDKLLMNLQDQALKRLEAEHVHTPLSFSQIQEMQRGAAQASVTSNVQQPSMLLQSPQPAIESIRRNTAPVQAPEVTSRHLDDKLKVEITENKVLSKDSEKMDDGNGIDPEGDENTVTVIAMVPMEYLANIYGEADAPTDGDAPIDEESADDQPTEERFLWGLLPFGNSMNSYSSGYGRGNMMSGGMGTMGSMGMRPMTMMSPFGGMRSGLFYRRLLGEHPNFGDENREVGDRRRRLMEEMINDDTIEGLYSSTLGGHHSTPTTFGSQNNNDFRNAIHDELGNKQRVNVAVPLRPANVMPSRGKDASVLPEKNAFSKVVCCQDCSAGDILCLARCERDCMDAAVCSEAGAGAYAAFCQNACQTQGLNGYIPFSSTFVPTNRCERECAARAVDLCERNGCLEHGCARSADYCAAQAVLACRINVPRK